jgi:hypothetical protein
MLRQIFIDGFSNNRMTVVLRRDHDRSSVDKSVQFALVGTLGPALSQCLKAGNPDGAACVGGGWHENQRIRLLSGCGRSNSTPGSHSSGLVWDVRAPTQEAIEGWKFRPARA